MNSILWTSKLLNGILSLLICGVLSNSLAQKPQSYLKAYPTFISHTTANSIVWRDSTQMVFDDESSKSFIELLENADLQDQLVQRYPKRFKNQSPPLNQDPGRFRYEPFFKKMYGSSEAEVEKKLVKVFWLRKSQNKTLLVTSINGVAQKLQAVSDELEQYPDLLKYVQNPAGTYKWRVIAGTNRLSTHSFGIAIDINLDFSHYWQWDCKCKDEASPLQYRNLIPQKVVEIFEKHGFIWGGKWYHYDTMHFEYRPELLIKN